MKNYFLKFACLLLCTGFLLSCSDDDNNYKTSMNGAYVFNFGNWGSGGASISQFDYNNSVMTNGFYKIVNGKELIGNIEYAYNYKDQTFLLENTPGQIITLNDTLAQLKNGVSLKNPRCCVGDGNYLYISCWGTTPDWNLMADSYIAKYDIKAESVVSTISLPGGPEGVEIANGKLYAALNYKDSIAVMDLKDNSPSFSYIKTPAVCSYFVKDDDDNLYVSLMSTYSNPSSSTGLGFIDTDIDIDTDTDTDTDQLTTTYLLPDVSSSYSQIMAINNDKSKIYVIAASYDDSSKLVGEVSVFDTESKEFDSDPIISNISGADAIAVNPYNGDIYLTTSSSFTYPGALNIYGADGTFKISKEAGVSPNHVIFL